MGDIDINAASLATAPKVDKKPIRPQDPDESRLFLEAIKGNRLEARYMVGVTIGLRQGEAFALRWEDIDLERSTRSVRHTLHRYKGFFSPLRRSAATAPSTCRPCL